MNPASSFPIENFSVAEKLLLMERLWDDLSRKPSDIPVPDWHGDILAERLTSVRNGQAKFVDWSEVKERLRERYQ